MAAPHRHFFSKVSGARESLRTLLAETIRSINKNGETLRMPRFIYFQGSLKFVRSYRITPTGASMENKGLPSNYLRDKMMVPSADPPRDKDVDLLYQFFERSSKLVILTGAGISTESGIPDYRRNLCVPVVPEGGIGLGVMLDGENLPQHNQGQHILH